MALKLYNDTDVQNIANAIRAKNGSSDTYKVSQMASAITAIPSGSSGGEYDINATIEGDFQQLDIVDYNYTPTTITPTASATATSGKTYTHLSLNSLTYAQISRYAKAISNASDITRSTNTVYIDDGDNYYTFSIGDTISYKLSTTELMIDQIIGFNHDDLTTSTAYGEATTTGKAGITFQMENCLSVKRSMNSTNTNAGGWGSSKIRTTELPVVKREMPADLQLVIKMVDKKSANGGGTNYTETITTSDDLFLLSEIELTNSGGSAQDGTNEGYVYRFWDLYNRADDRIKYSNGSWTETIYWYTRSCFLSNTTQFREVGTAGALTSAPATDTDGVSFAYCI